MLQFLTLSHQISFGNRADGTQRIVTPTSWWPVWQEGTTGSSTVSTNDNQTLRFLAPQGLGVVCAVSPAVSPPGLQLLRACCRGGGVVERTVVCLDGGKDDYARVGEDMSGVAGCLDATGNAGSVCGWGTVEGEGLRASRDGRGREGERVKVED